MNNNEKILESLKQVLDYELKAINHLKSFPDTGSDKSNSEVYIEIKKRIAEELKKAELLIRQVVVMEYTKKFSVSKGAGRDSCKKNRSARSNAGLTK